MYIIYASSYAFQEWNLITVQPFSLSIYCSFCNFSFITFNADKELNWKFSLSIPATSLTLVLFIVSTAVHETASISHILGQQSLLSFMYFIGPHFTISLMCVLKLKMMNRLFGQSDHKVKGLLFWIFKQHSHNCSLICCCVLSAK